MSPIFYINWGVCATKNISHLPSSSSGSVEAAAVKVSWYPL